VLCENLLCNFICRIAPVLPSKSIDSEKNYAKIIVDELTTQRAQKSEILILNGFYSLTRKSEIK
jgi:hypothetical protein